MKGFSLIKFCPQGGDISTTSRALNGNLPLQILQKQASDVKASQRCVGCLSQSHVRGNFYGSSSIII